jgi:hypothetical protein
MKKIITIFLLILSVSCAKDEELIILQPDQEVPQSLVIDEVQGLKLENLNVSSEVAINVKLPSDGIYRIKIKHGLNSELISQEKIQGKEGDNILKIYVNTLEVSSYRLELTDENHQLIGVTVFSKL